MTAESPAVIRRFKVGKFVCEMSLRRPEVGSVVCASCEWTPYMPKRLSADDLAAYRAGRDAAVAELAELVGGPAMVVEL